MCRVNPSASGNFGRFSACGWVGENLLIRSECHRNRGNQRDQQTHGDYTAELTCILYKDHTSKFLKLRTEPIIQRLICWILLHSLMVNVSPRYSEISAASDARVASCSMQMGRIPVCAAGCLSSATPAAAAPARRGGASVPTAAPAEPGSGPVPPTVPS